MQTHISTIERNLEVTNVWLKELCEELQDVEREEAWRRLGAVLQTMRDRIPVDEAANFAAQLPVLIRGYYYEGWKPESTPQKWRSKDEYCNAVVEKMGPRSPSAKEVDPEETIRAVLKVTARHINDDEIEKVKEMHSQEIQELWPN